MIVLADISRKKVSSNIVRTRHMKHSDVKICDTNFYYFYYIYPVFIYERNSDGQNSRRGEVKE